MNHTVTKPIVLCIGFVAIFWTVLVFLPSSSNTVIAQQPFVPIDCNIVSSPAVAYEISKGQNPANVSDFLADLQGLGYQVGTFDLESNSEFPACIDVLVIHGLTNNFGLPTGYSAAEANRIKSWVSSGHGLMLSGDWGNFKYPTQPLFQAFGYEQIGGLVDDATDHDPAGPAITPFAWVIYQTDNFAPHDILTGTNSLQLQVSGWLDSTTNGIVVTDADANPGQVPVMAAAAEGNGCAFFATDSNWYATDGGSGGYLKHDNAQIAQQVVAWLQNCEGTTPNTPPDDPVTYQLLLPLVMNRICQEGGVDIILAIDSSESMLDATEVGGPTKLSAAQDAAVEFLSLLDFNTDQAGVVSFDKTAVIDHTLSTNKTSLEGTIYGLDTAVYTRIDLGIQMSHQELFSSRHIPNNQQILILISDGKQWGAPETLVFDAATSAKASGITVYTVGLGQKVNPTLLQTIATSKDKYYFSPSTSDLTAIYTAIAKSLPCYGD